MNIKNYKKQCSEQHLDMTANLSLHCYMLHFLVQVEMQLPAAGWGVMNITSAGLQRWSFTDSVAEVAQPTHHQVRFGLSLVTMIKSKPLNDWGLLLGTCLLLSVGTEAAAVSQCGCYCTELFCSVCHICHSVIHVACVHIAKYDVYTNGMKQLHAGKQSCHIQRVTPAKVT